MCYNCTSYEFTQFQQFLAVLQFSSNFVSSYHENCHCCYYYGTCTLALNRFSNGNQLSTSWFLIDRVGLTESTLGVCVWSALMILCCTRLADKCMLFKLSYTYMYTVPWLPSACIICLVMTHSLWLNDFSIFSVLVCLLKWVWETSKGCNMEWNTIFSW